MPATSLYDVFRATIAAKLMYCSLAWSGFCSAADINRLDAFLKRCKRYGYCPDDFPSVSDLFSDADDQLFSRISHNVTHVLKPLLSTNTQHSYNFRDRRHSFVLIEKNSHINHRHFIIRQLYKYSYWLYICVLFMSCLELRFVNFLLNEYCIVLYCISSPKVCKHILNIWY